MNQQYSHGYPSAPVIQLGIDTRARFITRTYAHLFGAIVAFTLIEFLLFQSGAAESIAGALLGVNWLFVLGGFIVVSWLASHFAFNAQSLGVQYLALTGFVLAEAIIFVPLLYIAQEAAGGGVIESAAVVTLVGFGALTAIVFLTKQDFSFLGGVLKWAFVVVLMGIVGAVLFGFSLGNWFSLLMVGLAGAAILYDTSNVLHHFPEDRYVGAAMELFASVALMFWYVLRFFLMSRD